MGALQASELAGADRLAACIESITRSCVVNLPIRSNIAQRRRTSLPFVTRL